MVNIKQVLSFVLVGSILTISIGGLYFYFGSQPKKVEPTMIYMADFDNDTVPDDKDFYPRGNGGILIDVLNFKGDCKNLGVPCDPRFEIYLDVEGNGKLQRIVEKSYDNENEIENPIYKTFDIPDDWTRVRFEVRIKDMDGREWIDTWSGSKHSYGLIEGNLRGGTQTWTLKGDHEVHCEVTIQFKTVNMG